MPVTVCVGKKSFDSDNRKHAEENMFAVAKYQNGDLEVEMNGWPCTGERNHDCHALFIEQSRGRTITVTITDDHGGYARNHDKIFGATGTIIYQRGTVAYQ